MAPMCFISIVFARWRQCDQRHSAVVMLGVDVVKMLVAPPRARVRVVVLLGLGLEYFSVGALRP